MARFAVAIVNYNCPKYLETQVLRLRKYIKLNEGDSLDIILGDNSRKGSAIKKNQEICKELGVIYKRFHFDEGDYSSHHALALNEILKSWKHNFNSLLLIDHDIFLFDYSDIFLRTRERDFAGLAQNKIGRTYLHPGLLLINLDKVSSVDFNFLPCEHMDTGGRMADQVEKSNVEFLNIRYINYSAGAEDFYEVVDEKWMHFVKGSNWNKNKNHQERIDYLTKELENISK
jgi:hypothetical protein